jgi:outer membrane receptor protein involved in Fe transport
MNKFIKLTFSFCACFSLIFSLNIISQEIEEVVVTATKKEKSIQDLAVSVEAFTSESIDSNMIDDFSDLAEVVPGLITDKAIGSGASYSMRGVGSYGVGAAVVGSLVVSMNGHEYGSSSIAEIGFHDLERIEVLKGPQGTLNGRNAVQGLVNVITARPSSEWEGSFDLANGNYNSTRTNLMLNMPFSDSVAARLAYTTFERDGTIENIHTGNDIDGREQYGLRLSVDWDISDSTALEFTHDRSESDDNRQNIGIIVCTPHPVFGCDPFETGTYGQPADTRGSTASIFNFIAGLNSTADNNSYTGATVLNSLEKVNINRDPEHEQIFEMTTLQLNHDINDNYSMVAKVSYSTRDYYHMGDNDYSVATQKFPGLFPAGHPASFIPMEWVGCFGGIKGSGFCETIDSDRTYEFANVESETRQAEISIISDLDGPINFVVGAYHYDFTTTNVYQVQTASWNLISDGGLHPYNATLFGGALTGSGSTDFFVPWALSGFNAALLPVLLNGYTTPTPIQGFINEDHVRQKSFAIMGEVYYDLSEDTMLTMGLRYNDDVVKDSVASCLTFFSCPRYPASQKASGEYGFHPTQVVETDDAIGYKLAIQHNLSDNQMVYASYTTATKAGGNNPNSTGTPDPYDQEETGVFEIGTKSILLDGAMLFNAALFQNTTDGMLISSIVNAGSRNVNTDAEINGFEGNLLLFLNETTSIDLTWLKVDTEITALSLINPVNILNASSGLGNRVNIDPQGALAITTTDLGNVFKSAGYMCSVPFNPLGGVNCPTAGLGTPVDVSGNKLPQSPDLSYSLGLNKDFTTSNGIVSSRLAFRYMGEREGTVYNEAQTRVPEHKYWDASVTFRPNDGNWFVKFEGKNLNDDKYVGSWYMASGLQGGAKFATITDPRTWSIGFGTTF